MSILKAAISQPLAQSLIVFGDIYTLNYQRGGNRQMTITLDEAIKNNEEHSKAHRKDAYPAYYNALKLGSEALKAIQLEREFNPSEAFGWLPGETKD